MKLIAPDQGLNRQDQTPGSIAIWVTRSSIGENVRITALKGAEILLASHQTGGCDSPDPRTMGLVDRALWESRHNDPKAIDAECHPLCVPVSLQRNGGAAYLGEDAFHAYVPALPGCHSLETTV